MKITEKQLNSIISESIKKHINEIGDTPQGQFALNAVRGRAAARPRYQNKSYGNARAKAQQDAIVNQAGDAAYNARKSSDPNYKNKDMDAYANAGYNYGFNKGMHETINRVVSQVLKESIFDESFMTEKSPAKKHTKEREIAKAKKQAKHEHEKSRLAANIHRNDNVNKPNSNKNLDKKRQRVIEYLKQDRVDIAQFAYDLWPDKDEDSARSYFYKCLDGKLNDSGEHYRFSDEEVNRLYSMISDTE